MEPGGREPAPGGLRLIQEFVNTNDLEGGCDALGSAEDLRGWLRGHGLPMGEEPLGQADLALALEMREALRALAIANNGEPLDPRAVETINRTAQVSCVAVCLDREGRAILVPSQPGVRGALGRILAEMYAAMADGTWERLKACRYDVCRWVFYDHSKNRSGTWCTMSICGEKLNARAYRRRRKAGT